MQNTLAKTNLDCQESLPLNGEHFFPQTLGGANSTNLSSTTPIKEKLTYFEEIVRDNRIQEKEIGWWIGNVTAIKAKTFDTVMEDLAGNVNVVEFEKEAIDPKEKDLLFINSKFTYAISLIDKPNGREYTTKLSFSSRRKWLREYEVEAKRLADEYFPDSLLSM